MTITGRTIRQIVTLAVLGVVGLWIHEKNPTVQGIVDDLTRPLLGSKETAGPPERKRVVSEASQVLTLGEEKTIGAIRVGMTDRDVRRLLGDPDEIQNIVDDTYVRVRWTYRSVHRVVVFDRGRVVSIAVR